VAGCQRITHEHSDHVNHKESDDFEQEKHGAVADTMSRSACLGSRVERGELGKNSQKIEPLGSTIAEETSRFVGGLN
jgi:hypothetical protein